MESGASVQVTGLRRIFDGGVTAIDRLDLAAHPGEFVAILGPSGCGKSTLLRIIAGLDKATEGKVVLGNEAKIAYVFQDAHLLPWRNVLRNVALPLELLGIHKRQRLAAAEAALAQVGLSDAKKKYSEHHFCGRRHARALSPRL